MSTETTTATQTEDSMEDSQAPIFDTRAGTKKKTLYLIVDDGTKEGKKLKFAINPISSDVYLNIQVQMEKLKGLQKVQSSEKSDLNKAKDQMQAEDIIDKLIMPIVTPNKPFQDWVKDTLDKGAYVVYRQVMNQIISLAYDGVQSKTQS